MSTILSQATVEDGAAVTNLTDTNLTLTAKIAEYANHLSTKDSTIVALTNIISNLQGKVKNLKAKIQSIATNTGIAAGNHTAKREYKPNPTWWSSPYCWTHRVSNHEREDCHYEVEVHIYKTTIRNRIKGGRKGIPLGA